MGMSVGPASGEGDPMVEMNTTPLIDVMLVLLIMFIITIPVQTHAVKLDLPQDTGAPPPPVPSKNAPKQNAIRISCSRLSDDSDAIESFMIWNCPVSTATL